MLTNPQLPSKQRQILKNFKNNALVILFLGMVASATIWSIYTYNDTPYNNELSYKVTKRNTGSSRISSGSEMNNDAKWGKRIIILFGSIAGLSYYLFCIKKKVN